MSSSDIVRIAADTPTSRDVIFVAGFPGSGLVGSISVNYLVEKFGFSLLGCISSPLLPVNSSAVNGLARSSVRLYEKGNMVVLVSDVPIPDEAAYDIPLFVLEWLSERSRVNEVIVLGGVVTGGTGERVFGASTTTEGLSRLQSVAEILPALNLTGIIGGIFNEARIRNIPASGLLIETNFDVDPRAAAAGLEALAKMYSFNIDTHELIQQADAVEPMLLQLAEDVKNTDMRPITYEEEMMYG